LVILGDQVPDNLAAVAALRITHREVSLEALGQMMNPPMTKDAVAGRIRRLLALADNTAHRTGIPDTSTCPGRFFEGPVPPRQVLKASIGLSLPGCA